MTRSALSRAGFSTNLSSRQSAAARDLWVGCEQSHAAPLRSVPWICDFQRSRNSLHSDRALSQSENNKSISGPWLIAKGLHGFAESSAVLERALLIRDALSGWQGWLLFRAAALFDPGPWQPVVLSVAEGSRPVCSELLCCAVLFHDALSSEAKTTAAIPPFLEGHSQL